MKLKWMHDELKIAIANQGSYNEGILNYKWVSLPTDEETMKQALKEIGIGNLDKNGNPYEEIFIYTHDIEYPEIIHLDDKIGKYTSIEELNYLAQLLNKMSTGEYLQYLGLEIIKPPLYLKDLINYGIKENINRIAIEKPLKELYKGVDDIPKELKFSEEITKYFKAQYREELLQSVADYKNASYPFSLDGKVTTSSLKDSNIIGIDYTTTEDDKHEIQVDLNLEEMALVQKFDGVEIHKETFSSDINGMSRLINLFKAKTNSLNFDSFIEINEKAENTLEEKLNIIRDNDGNFKEKDSKKPSIIAKIDQFKSNKEILKNTPKKGRDLSL